VEHGNVQLVGRDGTSWAAVDNTGTRDAGAEINALIEEHWDAGGLDIFLAPGTYLIETPIVVTHSNIAIQGYTFGFAYRHYAGEGARRDPREWEGKTCLLVAPSCRDAIQIGPVPDLLVAFTLRNITIAGQNGRLGVQPDIHPEQNGVRVMPGAVTGTCIVDYCQFVHLTHGIINESPDSPMDVWYITDNWISECNVAIKLHTSIFASVISRNGFHDMSGTVLELRSINHTDLPTKEMVISDNTGWNPGKLVFDLEGFRGGTISDNAFVFNHDQVRSFARLRSCYMSHISGNTFVVDGDGPRTRNDLGEGGQGYEQDGERYDTLTMAGCSDCTVSGNSLISFHPERPVIRLGANAVTGESSHHNHVILNKVLPSVGFEGRPQIELTEGTEANLVVLPVIVGAADPRAVVDHGTGNQIAALPAAFGAR
jgi:hypothetical protein